MMRKLLPLIWSSVTYYKGKTITLTACLAAAFFLPLTVHWLVALLQDELTGRAAETPLVIGPRGSRFDLVLHALYFHAEAPGALRQAERFEIDGGGHASAIPLFIRHRAGGKPVVGTSPDYFAFRDIRLAAGDPMERLGDCVVGWQAARNLDLRPGDRLLSDPENLFDIGGVHPLDMRVTGILARTRSPDDHAVFVDLSTAWVIEGIGHGHDFSSGESGIATDHQRADAHHREGPPERTYTRVTRENVASFHFHGDPNDFPLTAILAVPRNRRSETLLLGRYVGDGSSNQILRPLEVIDEMLSLVVRLQRFFQVHHLLMLITTGLFVSLVLLLSLRLRQRESNTLFFLGCGRWTLFRIHAGELVLVLLASAALAGIASWVVVAVARSWVRTLTG